METVTFAQFGVFFACLIVLVMVIGSVVKIVRREPPLHREYVDRASYEIDRAEQKAESLRLAENRARLYQKVEDMGRDVSSLQTSSNLQSAQLHNLDAKVDRVLERLPQAKAPSA